MSEHNSDLDLDLVPSAAAHVRIPPEMIVASGVGREVTNWHRDLVQNVADEAATQDPRGRGGE